MNDRALEIKSVADELIRRCDRWAKDEHAEPHIPEDISLMIADADLICHSGDIPNSCRSLVTAVARLTEEQRKYDVNEMGARQRDQSPASSWWAAVKNVLAARKGADAAKVVRLESVADLLKQGVSRNQIAGHIYGRRGEGPLMQPSGVPDDSLIDQEAAKPGSVLIGWPDWVPPWFSTIVDNAKKLFDDQLAVFDKRQEGRKYSDPETAEQMLEAKCYVQQVMKGKGLTRDEVLEIAERIGVVPIDQPGYMPESVYSGEEATHYSKQAVDEKSAESAKAVEIWESSNREMGSAEVVAALKEVGIEMSTKAVGQAISWAKRRANKEAETAVTE